MPCVVVLGGSGMLGSMLVDELSRHDEFEVRATVRTDDSAKRATAALGDASWSALDVESADDTSVRGVMQGADWVINAIGVIKPFIDDSDPEKRRRALLVNALFPYRLASLAEEMGVRVIQIATDCVFSGARGSYAEDDRHDALDVYGKTKSLGEVPADRVLHLRCSIVGPEAKGHVSLLDWFLGQPEGGEVKGFTDHLWNGITTLHFARLCAGLIRTDASVSGVRHVIPGDTVSKADLLGIFARAFGRDDLRIREVRAPSVVDRTLRTADPATNARLWSAAGYEDPPSVANMVGELASFDLRLRERL